MQGRQYEMTNEEIIRILDNILEQTKADGCKGCAFLKIEEWEEPCRRCARNCKDYWRVGA